MISDEIRARIVAEREKGLSLRVIARMLDVEGIPTAYGGKWSASSIKYVLDRQSEKPK